MQQSFAISRCARSKSLGAETLSWETWMERESGLIFAFSFRTMNSRVARYLIGATFSRLRLFHSSSYIKMPELPEVERARRELASLAESNRIKNVVTYEDNIVYSGVTSDQFKTKLIGQVVSAVRRKGKNFYVRDGFASTCYSDRN